MKNIINFYLGDNMNELAVFEIDNDILNEVDEVLRYAQIFRTRTEMEVSVLNDVKFPTPDAKYWQAMREERAMITELYSLSFEYRKNIVNIKKLQRKLQNEEDDLERELLEIELEQKLWLKKEMEMVAKDRIREIKEWKDIKEKQNIEFSATDPDEHQLISYTRRWLNQALTMGNNGTAGERMNILGQLDKGLKMCREKGCLNKVIEGYPEEVKSLIARDMLSEGVNE